MKSILCIVGFFLITSPSSAQTTSRDTKRSYSAVPDSAGDFNKTFTLVEREASFKGGAKGWMKYLTKNLDIDVARRKGVKPGIYRVAMQFIVNEEGYVTDVHAYDSTIQCSSCIAEAIRVIQASPRWSPATQQGRPVIFQALQTIVFKND